MDFDLRFAMRGLASAVSLVSCRTSETERFVMPVTSLNALSFEPPLMLLCVNHSASSYAALATGVDFCISMLGASQASLARECTGGPMEERFSRGIWKDDTAGVPFLEDAMSSVICRQERRFQHRNHDFIVGEVRAVRVKNIVDPLIYADGTYQRLSGQAL